MLLKSWTLTTTTLFLLTATAQVTAAPTLADCKKLTDNFARLNCYDQMGLATEKTAVAPAAPQAAAPVVSIAPAPTSVPVQATTPAPAPLVTPNPAQATVTVVNVEDEFGMTKKKPAEVVEEIDGKVTAFERNKYDKLVVTLENRQVWRQTDSDYIDMKIGDVVVIKKASFGSFLMSNGRDNRKIRVKRVE